jgi:6-phosphogluconolactonase/glucosamine-6-phosphate isomerase/deaminase
MLNEDISAAIPATFLRTHPALSIYLDKEAARLID